MDIQLKQKIIEIDQRVIKILASGGQEALVLSLHDLMIEVKPVLDAYKGDKFNHAFNQICAQYDGFYQLMKMLENLAYMISNGEIEVPPL